MLPYAVPLEDARSAFPEALAAFLEVTDSLDDHALLAPSRCAGWQVADVVVHVHLGLQEMALGLLSPTSGEPDTDAASYWAVQPPATDPGTDELDSVRFVHRLAAAYTRPRGAVAHLRMTADALGRAVASVSIERVAFQGRVLRTGDFLATWVTELAVHQLDLAAELDLPAPPRSALAVARATVDALVGRALPSSWSDVDTVLLGAGRVTLGSSQRAEVGDLARLLGAEPAGLPVLG